MNISLKVNGQVYQVEADPRAPLLETLREQLGLRGTKYGCGEGECGACSVLLNDRAVNTCLTLTGQAHGGQIVTVEGLAGDAIGGRLVEAFCESGAVQCGYCTPGFIVAARALLAGHDSLDTEAIQRGLSGNLCRCTGYTKIIEAIAEAAQAAPPFAAAESHKPIPALAASAAEYARPATLSDALETLSQPERQWRVIAGGTDLLVEYEHRVKALSLLDITGLAELQRIEETEDDIRIGALASYSDIINSPLVHTWAAPLAMAAREVGGAQIQNRGTLGGNLANASPAADSMPALYVLGAQVTLCSSRGRRSVSIHAIAHGPRSTIVAPDELIAEILIPKRRHAGQEIAFFEKVGPRKALTIAKASVAFRGWLQAGRLTHVQVALGAVAPTVIYAPQTAAHLMSAPFDEEILMRAGDIVQAECRPIDDLRSTAAYRRKLARGLLIRNLWPYRAATFHLSPD